MGKRKSFGILAAIFIGLNITDWVLGFLGNMDLIVSRIEDPGWMGKVINFLLFEPPAWFSIGLLLTAIILLVYVSWNTKQKNEETELSKNKDQEHLPHKEFPLADIDEWRRTDPLLLWQAGCLWKGISPMTWSTFLLQPS